VGHPVRWDLGRWERPERRPALHVHVPVAHN
jgi:hypothetical protein